jgi:hypothetical protein
MLPIKSLFHLLFTSADSRTVDLGDFSCQLSSEEEDALFKNGDKISYREFLDYFSGNPDSPIPQELATVLVSLTLARGPIEDYLYIERQIPTKP